MGELLVQDMSRRGIIDGRGLRLPTVSIRPGKANAAASSFMSSIFRDTMQGNAANCPLGRDYKVWHTAPRTIIDNLVHAASVPAEASKIALGWRGTIGHQKALDLGFKADRSFEDTVKWFLEDDIVR